MDAPPPTSAQRLPGAAPVGKVPPALENSLEPPFFQAIVFAVTVSEVKDLPVREKLQLMEAIWEDLRTHFENSDPPASHRELLDERRRRVEEGQACLLDWDEVKLTLGRG